MAITGQSVLDPCAESFFTQLFQGNALLCSQKAQLAENEKAQIEDVVNNVDLYYGGDSASAQVARQAADAQEMNIKHDVDTIVTGIGDSPLFHPFQNPDCNGFDLSIVGGKCINKWWIYGAITIVVLFVLGPYILPFVGAFKRVK